VSVLDALAAIGLSARVDAASDIIARLEVAVAIALANPDNERGAAALERVEGYLDDIAECPL